VQHFATWCGVDDTAQLLHRAPTKGRHSKRVLPVNLLTVWVKTGFSGLDFVLVLIQFGAK
jgi:hypothetical protein